MTIGAGRPRPDSPAPLDAKEGDERGDLWVVDGAARVVSVYDFADECQIAGRMAYRRERAAVARAIATSVKEAFARLVKGLQRPGAKAAHA